MITRLVFVLVLALAVVWVLNHSSLGPWLYVTARKLAQQAGLPAGGGA